MEYKILDRFIGEHANNHDGRDLINTHNVLSGICPFCNESSGFKQMNVASNNLTPLKCDTCQSYVLYAHIQEMLLPIATPNTLNNIPHEIDKYYKEALRCISALSPNGAATLFRKLIHQVGIYYKVATVKDNKPIMAIVDAIKAAGYINNKLLEALKNVRDLGNDGAHVNDNEPTMEQIYIIKNLIDSFLQTTVLQDINIENFEKSKNSNNKLTEKIPFN